MRPLVCITALIILRFSSEAGAQIVDLRTCVTREPADCWEIGAGGLADLGCGQTYEYFAGRVSWFPLRCVGPVTIEINARATELNRYPLYVEIVPLLPGNTACLDPGYVVMVARGGWTCGTWESAEVDLPSFVALGSTYALQIVFFTTADGVFESPGLDCIRLTAHPTSAAALSWGNLKALYR